MRLPAAVAGGMAFLLCVAMAMAADAPPFAFQPNTPAPGHGVVHVTGVGLPPRIYGPRGQMHLMAERAAVVSAYRNLALALGQGSLIVADGSRYITTSGYVQGAQITQTRYYPDGRVEVDMTLAVEHPPVAPAIMPPSPPLQPPQKVETQKRQISEKEWLELYKQPKENKLQVEKEKL
ncbi:MAG: hypothetical protein NT105_03890 [Verrucomicrobia bacterium]|nr:hypothetical protein [Verrucomicrobiota bacterium]